MSYHCRVTARAIEHFVKVNPPFAGAMQCLQAPARSSTCAQGSRPCIFLENASVGEAQLGGCLLDACILVRPTKHWGILAVGLFPVTEVTASAAENRERVRTGQYQGRLGRTIRKHCFLA
jgi:hypothetical protein